MYPDRPRLTRSTFQSTIQKAQCSTAWSSEVDFSFEFNLLTNNEHNFQPWWGVSGYVPLGGYSWKWLAKNSLLLMGMRFWQTAMDFNLKGRVAFVWNRNAPRIRSFDRSQNFHKGSPKFMKTRRCLPDLWRDGFRTLDPLMSLWAIK